MTCRYETRILRLKVFFNIRINFELIVDVLYIWHVGGSVGLIERPTNLTRSSINKIIQNACGILESKKNIFMPVLGGDGCVNEIEELNSEKTNIIVDIQSHEFVL